jgi:hypothetical protein
VHRQQPGVTRGRRALVLSSSKHERHDIGGRQEMEEPGNAGLFHFLRFAFSA